MVISASNTQVRTSAIRRELFKEFGRGVSAIFESTESRALGSLMREPETIRVSSAEIGTAFAQWVERMRGAEVRLVTLEGMLDFGQDAPDPTAVRGRGRPLPVPSR